MDFYLPFIELRLAQALRWIKSLGLAYLVLLSCGLVIGLIALIPNLGKPNIAWFFSAGSIAFIGLIRISRKDYRFLKICTPNDKLVIKLDLLLLALFPFLLLLITGMFFQAAFLVLVLLLSFVKPLRSSKGKVFNLPFKDRLPFEWLSAIRSRPFFFLILFILGVISAFFPYAVIAFLFILIVLLMEGYQVCESRLMLESYNRRPSSFLFYKLRQSSLCLLGLSAPFISISMAVLSEGRIIVIIFFLYALILNAYFLFTKYAYYEPGERISSQQVISAMVMISPLLPFLSPLPIFLVFRNYRKAIQTLNLYLDDFN